MADCDTPLAIVGLACRLPEADNLDEFWKLLVAGRSAIRDLSEEKLPRALYFDPTKGVRGKSYSAIGGCVPPKPLASGELPLPEALQRRSDPGHLAFCQVALDACRQAGFDPRHMPLHRGGVYVGSTRGRSPVGDINLNTLIDHVAGWLREIPEFNAALQQQSQSVVEEIIAAVRKTCAHRTAQFGPDTSAFLVASLVSQALGFDGPFQAINAACASSLIALAMAARALKLGHIDVAVVGGASHFNVDSLLLFSKAQSVSATGSRPFDESADGLATAEGYVALVLTTLQQAVERGFPIQAVIHGIGVASDGKGKSLWAPRKEGQILAVQRAYANSAEIAKLQFIEGHATSTQVGDATEISALSEAMLPHLPPGKKIPLGAVKGNIGHTLETAGLAGLAKTVLALQHGIVPPNINIERLNPKIDWDSAPFLIPTQPMPWPDVAGQARRAAVNSFGIGGLNAHVVLDQYQPTTRPVYVSRPQLTPDERAIAVVGYGAILPGARTAEHLWKLLQSADDPKTEVPADRWQSALAHHPQHDQPGQTVCKFGGFITDFQYDWKKHKVPPKQVAQADPLQFMFLDAVDQALHSAGYLDKPFNRQRTGVLVGTESCSDFSVELQVGVRFRYLESLLKNALQQRSMSQENSDRICQLFADLLFQRYPALEDETGSFTSSSLAARITKTFDLMGGAAAVNAGDVSAAVVLQLCADTLLAGECDLMICLAGQRSLSLPVFETLSLRGELHAGTPQHLLDGRAQGFVPGEGVGVLLLKRLADARRDGDRILSIVRGIGDSRQNDPQQALTTAMRRAFEVANISPSDVALLQTTAVGQASRDVQESQAIQAVYGTSPRKQPLQLGSAASRFGHMGTAAGMASLLTASLALEHKQTAAEPNCPQPAAHWSGHSIATSTSPLSAQADGRMFAGVNVLQQGDLAYHILVERGQPIPTEKPTSSMPSPMTVSVAPHAPRIVKAAAASLADLARQTEALATQAETAFAQSLEFRWPAASPWRLAVVAASPDELAEKCRAAAQQMQQVHSPSRLMQQGIFWTQRPQRRPQVAWLFPGQGSQYAGMFQSLCTQYAPAAEIVRMMDENLAALGFPSVRQTLWEEADLLGADVWRTQLAMLLGDALVCGILNHWGLRPDVVAGHSYGEFPALFAAGVWNFSAVAQATYARCQSIEQATSAAGVMMSVAASWDEVERYCRKVGGPVYPSNHNTPHQTVVGGTQAAVDQLAQLLTAQGVAFRPIKVPRPFHTPLMHDVQQPLRTALSAIPLQPPQVPVLSSVTNRYVADPDEIRDNLVTQMTQPVRYVHLIERLAHDGITMFFEVGSDQVLTKLHQKILPDQPVVLLAADDRKQGGLAKLLAVRACAEVWGLLDDAPAEVAPAPSITEQKPEVKMPAVKVTSLVKEDQPAPFPVLKLEGTPFEIGYQLGKSQAGEIQALLRRYADMAGRYDDSFPPLDQAIELVDTFFMPDDWQELQGIAAGANAPLDSILAHNLHIYPDINPLAGCVQVAISAQANGEHGLLHAANEELPLTLRMRECLQRNVQVRSRAGYFPWVTTGIAGQAGGINGMNSQGLTVTSAMLLDLPRRPETMQGRLHGMVIKRMLECAADVESALDILRDLPHTGGWGVCLSHAASDRVCYAEYDGRRLTVAPASPKCIAANHTLLYSPVAATPAHSQYRLQRLVQLLQDAPSVPASQLQAALRDRFDGQRKRETTHPTMNTIRRVDNQVSLVFQPSQCRLWVTAGPVAGDAQNHYFSVDWQQYITPTIPPATLPKISLPPAPPITAPSIPPPKSETSTPVVDNPPLTPSQFVEQSHTENITPAFDIQTRTTQRYVMRDVVSPLPALKDAWHPTGTCLIWGGGAEELKQELERRGGQVVLLPEGATLEEQKAAVDGSWQSGPAPHLFLFTHHHAASADLLEINQWNKVRCERVTVPYFLCQHWYRKVVEADLLNQATLVATVSLGGRLSLSGGIARPEGGALTGLLKGLKLENVRQMQSTFRALAVDVGADIDTTKLVENICAELSLPLDQTDVEVGYSAVGRVVPRPLPEMPTQETSNCPPSGVWVVTGGARGVTAFVARELARRFQLKLHLLGSSPLPQLDAAWRNLNDEQLKALRAQVMKEAVARKQVPAVAWSKVEKAIEIDANLQQFAAAGVAVKYHVCDVSNREAVAKALAEIRKQDGPISGVLHGAGFEKAARFDRKKPELVETTLAVKLDGAAHLLALTKDDPLRHFVSFGSTSGRFGGVGQTDYCVANDALSKLVNWHQQQRPTCRSVCFHWSAWGGVGMAVRPETKSVLEAFGVAFMPPEEGAIHVAEELLLPAAETELVVYDWARFKRTYPDQTLTSTAPAFPLVSACATTNGQAQGELLLDPVHDAFLVQHQFKGRPLMPFVVSTEALAETALHQAGVGQTVTALHTLTVENPLRFLTDRPLAARVLAQAHPEKPGLWNERLVSDLENRKGMLLLKDKMYFSGSVEVGQRQALKVPPMTLPSHWNDVWYTDDVETLYHGPIFRCLKQARIPGQEGWGRLEVEELQTFGGSRGGAGWLVCPPLLDACMFACGVLLWVRRPGAVTVPLAIDHLRLGTKDPQPGEHIVHCQLVEEQAEQATFNFVVYTSRGEPVWQVEGYRGVIVPGMEVK